MTLDKLNPKSHFLTIEQGGALTKLCVILTTIENEFGKELTVDRAFSTMSEHLAIYDKINSERVKHSLQPVPVPLSSAHLRGCAADIADVDGSLFKFLKERETFRKNLGIALEDKASTPSWVHIQTYLPASGHLIFKP